MTPSAAVATISTICVIRMILLRWKISASAPAIRPTISVGAVLADCTSATINGDGVIVAICHAAVVTCIV